MAVGSKTTSTEATYIANPFSKISLCIFSLKLADYSSVVISELPFLTFFVGSTRGVYDIRQLVRSGGTRYGRPERIHCMAFFLASSLSLCWIAPFK